MRIFLVSIGQDKDFCLKGICSTKRKADNLIKLFKKLSNWHRDNMNPPYEWIVDDEDVAKSVKKALKRKKLEDIKECEEG
jgi:hypothetical protein